MPQEEDIDWREVIINCEWRVGVLELIIDRLIELTPPETVTPKRLEDWRREALAELRLKYPKAGLERTKRIHLPEGVESLKQSVEKVVTNPPPGQTQFRP
jgi:hypothetical protein